MNKWIPLPRSEGETSRQAHADLPKGTYEREISKEGFLGPAAHFHHRHPPTSWRDFTGPLSPRAFDLNKIESRGDCPWGAPTILSNAHIDMRMWRLSDNMPALARNADGDQLLFIHVGAGDLFCDYGRLIYEAGDYIMLPRGTLWRLEPRGETHILMIEATNTHYRLPDKGLLGPHAIFDPAVLDTPVMDDVFCAQQDETAWRVHIKKRGAVSTVTYPFNPLDAIGWHGDLCVVRLNVRDIRPINSHRYHVPPSAHTTFVADRFVVCTFAPRPFETDEGALKVPFFHNNDDYDEVLFYHAGDFFSRDGIDAGMMTFHPSGFTHGPHPKALKNMLTQPKSHTDEYAVMIDTRDPLDVSAEAGAVENSDYVNSWKSVEPAE
jgi:homogentisate 1,2-dioxygenase